MVIFHSYVKLPEGKCGEKSMGNSPSSDVVEICHNPTLGGLEHVL